MKTFVATLGISLLLTINAMGNSIYDLQVETIDGEVKSLRDYEGKALLIVNVASKCGFTGQYENLEALYQKYRDQGLVVLGFPCNQFGGQEPGTSQEIKQFCSLNYNVTFPMHAKVDVNGPSQHPLYARLTGDGSPFPGKIRWNFNKFLISRDGTILNRFGSLVNPESKKLVAAIEEAL